MTSISSCPGQSLESVEMLANPFAAEYGRFSTSVTQIRTRRGTNDWEIKPGNLMPRLRQGVQRRARFRAALLGPRPAQKDRLFLAQDLQFRYVNDPVKSLPGEPEIGLTSFDSFTRIDSVLSTRHTLGGLVVMFPRRIEHLTMNTFRPPEVTPAFTQSGTSVGVQDRFALSPTIVLESTFAGRWFEINVNTDGRAADDLHARDAARQLLQRSGTRSQKRAVGRDAVARRSTSGVESTCSSSASTFRTPGTTARV